MSKPNRSTLERQAEQLGYALAEAHPSDIGRAQHSNKLDYDAKPRWMLTEVSDYADREVVFCNTLLDVEIKLDCIKIDQSLTA